MIKFHWKWTHMNKTTHTEFIVSDGETNVWHSQAITVRFYVLFWLSVCVIKEEIKIYALERVRNA